MDEQDRLTDAVIRRIGDPARDLRDDPEITLEAIADQIGHGPATAGLVARRRDQSWEIRTTPEGDPGPVVDALVGHVSRAGGGPTTWLALAAGRDDRLAADRAGLRRSRGLFQMRCSLPHPDHATVGVRPYDPAADRGVWLEVNNRAFAAHPDQGGWTEADVMAREREGWFDPEGFLLHEIDDRLAAFCWTKVHADDDPPLGEIYVIAVDPHYRGLGLGRQLTLAGLDHLADRGLEVGMLYVEDDNEAAVGLYRRLGFHRHHEDVFFTGSVDPA